MSKEHDSCVIVSGGLDSTILVYDMIAHGYWPHMLSFNYGQRHKKELTFASHTAIKLGLQHDIIDLSGITDLISNSALTAGVARHTKPIPANDLAAGRPVEWVSTPHIEVPEGHYAEDTMKATVVPNRNMIMLSIAAGVAVNNRYRRIGIGVHGGDHFIYPDCRPEFVDAAAEAISVGNDGFHNFDKARRQDGEVYEPVLAPYLHGSKADIAYRGLELNVPFEETWSCYKGGELHCGKCGTCVERLEAIDEAEQHWADQGAHVVTADRTEYEDSTFWREAVASRS